MGIIELLERRLETDEACRNGTTEKNREWNSGAILRACFPRCVGYRPKLDRIVDALDVLRADRRVSEVSSPTNQGPDRVGNEELPCISRVADPRGHSHRKTDDIAVFLGDFVGVDPDPYADPASLFGLAAVEGDPFLDALGRYHGIHRRVKDGEGTVAEILDEPTTSRQQGVANDPVVFCANRVGDIISESLPEAR